MAGSPPATADTTRRVVELFLSHWAAERFAECLALIDENAVYILHLDKAALPFAGETQGREAIASALRRMRQDFDYVLYRPFPLTVEEERAHGQIEFIYLHRKSGQTLSGRMRCIWTVKDGLIVRCEEFHDAARIETFLRLVKDSGA